MSECDREDEASDVESDEEEVVFRNRPIVQLLSGSKESDDVLKRYQDISPRIYKELISRPSQNYLTFGVGRRRRTYSNNGNTPFIMVKESRPTSCIVM